jgi:hypothetical protein
MTEPGSPHLLRFPTRMRVATEADAAIPARLVDPGSIAVGAAPKTIQNWDFYDGAVVAIAFSDGKKLDICGSGVMVAPGLVLTATHVVRDHYDSLDTETRSLYCLGIRSGGRADLWVLRTLRYPEDESDITFLGVEPSWEITEDEFIPCLPISTREPQLGETLTIVGFRYPDQGQDKEPERIDGIPVAAKGDLYASAGKVVAVYEYRDRVMAPFPMIEIACGSLGAMSGGPAFDQFGHVVGVLSSGWRDNEPPSNVAWIIHALMFGADLRWPPGAYTPETPILELPDKRLTIVGRDKIKLTGMQQVDYRRWS